MNIKLRYRKGTYILCTLLSIMCSCYTQHKRNCTEKYSYVDSLIEQHKDSFFQHPDIAKKELLNARLSRIDSIDYYKLTQFISYAYFQESHLDSAFLLNNKVLDFCRERSSYPQRMAELKMYACLHRSSFFLIINQNDSALLYLKKSYNAAFQSKNNKELATICINTAYDYTLHGNYSMASLFYKRAKNAADSLHLNSIVYSYINAGLARIYVDLNNYKLSNYYFFLAEKDYKVMPSYRKYLFASMRACFYYKTKKYRKALEWYTKANNVTNTFKLNTYRGITECNLGEIYLLLNQTDSAKYYLDKAIVSFSKSNKNENHSFYINGLYAELALQKNDLKSAHRLLFKKYDLSKISSKYIYLYDKKLELYYKKNGDFKKAYFYRTKADILNDSLYKKTISNAILEIDTRYSQDTTKLKQNIILSESKAEMQKMRFTTILSLSISLAIIIIVVLYIYYYRKKRESKYAKQLATITKLRMENVRNRMCPHILFNMLNAVMPTLKQDDNQVKLFRLVIQSLRNNLIVCEKIAVPLEEEVEFVRSYIEFRKKTTDTKIEVNWNISAEVSLKSLTPTMIMQIPIENSIKFAFEEEQDDAHIDIKISSDNIFLYITIEDNGTGYNPGKHIGDKNSTGIGLKVIFQTIELLNRRNKENIFFNIDDLKKLSPDMHGTRISIIIPFKYNFEI